jgi:hypothetical protein
MYFQIIQITISIGTKKLNAYIDPARSDLSTTKENSKDDGIGKK